CFLCPPYEEICYDCLLSTRQCNGQNMTLECDENYCINVSSVIHGTAKPCDGNIKCSNVNEQRLNYISETFNGLEKCSFQSTPTEYCDFFGVDNNYEQVFYECAPDPKPSTKPSTTTHFATTLQHTIHSSTILPNDKSTTATTTQSTQTSSEPATTQPTTTKFQSSVGNTSVSTAGSTIGRTGNLNTTIADLTTETHELTTYRERILEHQAHITTIIVPSVVGLLVLFSMIAFMAVFLVRKKRKATKKYNK
ncbi:unnamed protein product, partial [Owenia fusiformis]